MTATSQEQLILMTPPLFPDAEAVVAHPRTALCRPDKNEAAAAEAKPAPSVKSPSAEAAEILATSGGLAKGGAHAPMPPTVTGISPAAAAPIGVQATPPTSNAGPMNDRQAGGVAVSTPAAAPAVSVVAPQSTGPASASRAQQPAAAMPVSLPASDAGTASAPPPSVPVLSTSEAPAAAPTAVPTSASVPAPVQAAPQSAPATPVRRSMLMMGLPPSTLPPRVCLQRLRTGRRMSTDHDRTGGMRRPLLHAVIHHMPRELEALRSVTPVSCIDDAQCSPVAEGADKRQAGRDLKAGRVRGAAQRGERAAAGEPAVSEDQGPQLRRAAHEFGSRCATCHVTVPERKLPDTLCC